MRPFFNVLLLATSIFVCNEEPLVSPDQIRIKISNVDPTDSIISLTINDRFGYLFIQKDVVLKEGETTFDYTPYRPMIAILTVSGKENSIYLLPNEHNYEFELDSSGYIRLNNPILAYINDLSYLSQHGCNFKKDIQNCMSCIDAFVLRKENVLKKYRELGLPTQFYNQEKTNLFYLKYALYGQVALYRKGYAEIVENLKPVKDSILSMNPNFGLYQTSTNRVLAISQGSLLDRPVDPKIKNFNKNALAILYQQNPSDQYLATHILSYLYDNINTPSSLIDSLINSSNPIFVTELISIKEQRNVYGKNIFSKYWVDENLENFSDQHFKDKVILLNFWFPGCRPCIKSIPEKNAIVTKYQNEERFELINVCSDFSVEQWKRKLDSYDMKGVHVFVPEELQKEHNDYYQLHSFPKYLIVSSNKIISSKEYRPGSKELEDQIDAAMLSNK